MKILLHHPSGTDGTSFYRAFGPFNAMAHKDPEIHLVDGNTEIAWPFLSQFDLVFIQRPASPWHMSLVEMCMEYNVPVWVDWDDNYFDIPDVNPRKSMYSPFHIDLVRRIAKCADYITVSTHHLLREFSQFNQNIAVVPNALDTRLFDPEAYQEYGRENTILWRGSDTHHDDLDHFKEQIIQLMDETPEYVWAFVGYCPEWAAKHLPAHRFRHYDYAGPIEYVRTLFAIRPTLVYVPMVDSPFNRSRSNVAWIEATYAGAAVVAPAWEEWSFLPCAWYQNREQFIESFRFALRNGETMIKESSHYLYKNLKLQTVNDVRFKILHSLVGKSPVERRRKMLPPVDPQPFTDEQFFQFNCEHGWCQNNPAWIAGQEKFADYLTKELGGLSFMDIGCGTGTLLEVLLKRGHVAYGIDTNRHNFELFKDRNPEYVDKFLRYSAAEVVMGNKIDVVTCIEVFEHLPDEVCRQVLANWRGRTKFFVFSSTPYHSTPHFDTQWGHINVKPVARWIELFRECGYVFVQNLDYPTKWSLLFVSDNVTS